MDSLTPINSCFQSNQKIVRFKAKFQDQLQEQLRKTWSLVKVQIEFAVHFHLTIHLFDATLNLGTIACKMQLFMKQGIL